jgi:outer membrane protein OmpA-like peptidoglycan-associated protein
VFGQAQETIYLNNPSFEDTPRMGGREYNRAIQKWFDCGEIHFKGETPPDIHPTHNSAWGVSKYAMDGDTYLGLVVRDNDSWEAVSQHLSSPLKAGQCYAFSILLSTSKSYVSATRTTGAVDNYDEPSVLRIWGSNRYCGYAYPSALLATSETIVNDEWRQFNFKIEPASDFDYIILEAFYKTPTLIPYNGHILLDGASDFVPIPCDTEIENEPMLVSNSLEEEDIVEEVVIPVEQTKPKKADFKSPAADIGIAETPRAVAPQAEPKPKPAETNKPKQTPVTIPKEKTLGGVKRDKIREGQTVLIDKLYFEPDSFSIIRNSYPILNEIYYFLKDNEDIAVEIQGHTNGNRGITHEYCDNLSTKRAKEVASYLAKKGIEVDRLKYKGYGKRKPIASNRTKEGKARNQRVEIKILSIKN